MDRHVAHGASLILLGLVMYWSRGSLRRKGMALQTKQVHLADPQQSRVRGSMGGVATGTTLSFHWHVFVDEGAALIGVALGTNEIPVRQFAHLPQPGGAMDVVTITALH